MTWRRFTSATFLACVLWVLCAAYATRFIERGWIAHDEGTVGQSAERVLSGQVPHRDFDEVYTGGLTYLHAAGMKLFGVNLRAPRFVLFGFFMAFLAAVFGIARRVTSPYGALVVMAVVTAWSVPNYFVSLPSWYNLFFATFGVLALLHHLETGRRRWLFLAGVCGGLSMLVKVAGLYYLAGGLLFLAYVERTTFVATAGARQGRSGFWPIAAIPAAAMILLCLALLTSSPPALLQLFVPALGICLFVAWREWTDGHGGFAHRAGRFALLAWPFAAGAVVVVAAFVLWFWQQHAMAEFVRGVLVLPQRRLTEAIATPPAIGALGLAVPYGLLLLAGVRRGIPREWLVAVVVAGLLGAVLMMGFHRHVYQATWAVARAMPIIAVVAGLWILGQRRGSTGTDAPAGHTRMFLVVTMAAMTALVQFPYATPIYFCYAAPMTVLALAAIVSAQPLAPRRVHAVTAAFFFAFAIVFMNRSYGWNLGVAYLPYEPTSRLDIARGGLLVPEADKRTYEEIVRLIEEHAKGGTIYAGPDCPEVYFLSGSPNPTRAIFEFLSPLHEDERWMNDLLVNAPIRAAVVNTAPLFSPPLDAGALAVLERRFPKAVRVGRFVVRFD